MTWSIEPLKKFTIVQGSLAISNFDVLSVFLLPTAVLGAIAASTAVGSKNTDSTSKLEIARDPWTIVNFFNGSIDQVIVYKRALTASQLLALYQARIPGGPQVYLQPTDYPSGSGLIRAQRSALEGM